MSLRYKTLMCALAALWFFLAMENVLTPGVAHCLHVRAQRLASEGRYQAAAELYGRASALEPSNTGHLTAFAEFLAGYVAGAVELGLAEDLYSLALVHNHRCAEYHYRRALLQLRLADMIFAGKGIPAMTPYVSRAIDGIRLAVVNDPNGFNTALRTGTLSLVLWNALDEEDRLLFLGRLRSVIRQRPWYAESHIYPLILRYAGDRRLAVLVTPETGEARAALRRFLDKFGGVESNDGNDSAQESIREVLFRENAHG